MATASSAVEYPVAVAICRTAGLIDRGAGRRVRAGIETGDDAVAIRVGHRLHLECTDVRGAADAGEIALISEGWSDGIAAVNKNAAGIRRRQGGGEAAVGE